MAYIKNQNQNQKQGPISTSGQSSIISANATDPNASDAQGTGWTDLKKYLDNNTGLGAGVGQAVTADSQGKIDGAASKINEFQTKAVAANQSGVNQNKSLDAYKSQIAADPTKVNASAFKNDISSGYKGLTDAQSADGYTDAFNAYGGAKSGYESLKSDDWSNRSQAVSDTYGKSNAGYTKGMGMLDTFILQGDKSGKDQISGFLNKNANTFSGDGKDALSTAKNGVQSALDNEKNRWSTLLGDSSTEGSLSKTVNEKRSGLVSNLDGRQSQVDALNAPLNEQEDVLRAVAAQVAKNAGLPYDANTYIERSNFGLGDTVSDSERAELDALNNLGSGDSAVDLSKYKAGTGQGVSVSQAAINAGNGYKYDPKTNQLVSVGKNGTNGDLTNSPYYKSIMDQVFKAKGYK